MAATEAPRHPGGVEVYSAGQIGAQRVDALIENPDGPPVPNAEGGFTQPFKTLEPVWWLAIRPATTRDLDKLERLGPGTTVSTTVLIANGSYLVGITTSTRVSWRDARNQLHHANVSGIANPDGACIEMQLVLVETFV